MPRRRNNRWAGTARTISTIPGSTAAPGAPPNTPGTRDGRNRMLMVAAYARDTRRTSSNPWSVAAFACSPSNPRGCWPRRDRRQPACSRA
ncbi:hypothetical protein BJF90_07840 [Pseudonocardia sp. CNS-004]|nr:hypothetical protein BJF90_07840 [Pseudonocardia sp. CNS-004]